MKKSLIIAVSLIFLIGFIVYIGFFNRKNITDTWPNRDITILVGANVGGGLDTMARMVAPRLREELGVSVVTINIPGANHSIALEQLLANPSDGYSIFTFSAGTLTYPVSAISDYDYRDFMAIAITQATQPVICVPIDSQIVTMDEFLDAIKRGDTTAATSSGVGGMYQMPKLVIANAVDGSSTFVPYDGGVQLATAIAQKEVDWGMCDLSEAMSFINSGLVRPLAIYSITDTYMEGYGSIPSILNWLPEIKEYIPLTNGFRGFAIKRDTPQEIVKVLTEALRLVLNSPDLEKATEEMYIIPLELFGEEADEMMIEATHFLSWLIYDMGTAERDPSTVGIERTNGIRR